MLIAGNILKRALKAVGGGTVTWRARVSRSQDARGDFTASYAPDRELYGSWQPLSSDSSIGGSQGYSRSGEMAQFFVSADVLGTDRMQSGDVIIRDCAAYDVVQVSDWYRQSGWKVITCCKQI